MNKSLYVLLGVSTGMVLATGWGTSDTNVAAEKKQSVDFYGTLETWANPDTEIKIENISIDNLYKQIPFFLKPAVSEKKSEAPATAIDCSKCCPDKAGATEKKYKEFILEGDPRNTLIETKVDLAEVSEIIVPHPDELWTYQKEKGYNKVEYIEMVIISKDAKKTKTSYLIEKRKRIYSDRVNTAGPEEQEVPLEAVKSLKLEGYRDRKLEETKRKQEEERLKIKELSQSTSVTEDKQKESTTTPQS